MPTSALRLLSLLLVAFLAGCVGDRTERIHVRREPGILEEQERIKRMDYEAYLVEREAAAERRRLPGPLKRAHNRRKLAERKINLLLTDIPEDPWEAYEGERHEVLYRVWADVGYLPPDPATLPPLDGEEGGAGSDAGDDDDDYGDDDDDDYEDDDDY